MDYPLNSDEEANDDQDNVGKLSNITSLQKNVRMGLSNADGSKNNKIIKKQLNIM